MFSRINVLLRMSVSAANLTMFCHMHCDCKVSFNEFVLAQTSVAVLV